MNDSYSPIVIGGSGHSGTRVFSEILAQCGVFTGIRHVTKRAGSEDLNMIGLLNRWVLRYVSGELTPAELARMRREFALRLRLFFPLRNMPWGFKNPRAMLILPFLHEMFPDMKFVHVVRDGRDISLGNEFASRNRYRSAFLTEGEMGLSAEEAMILFWGRSNQRAMEYGQQRMQGRYLLMRWEDLCADPVRKTAELLEFASCPVADAARVAKIVRKPKSIGRWRSFPERMWRNVHARGAPWLSAFGYR